MSGKGKSSLWYLVSKLQPAASPDHPSYVSLILHGEKEEDELRPSWLQASAMSLVSSGRAFKREAPASAIAHHCHNVTFFRFHYSANICSYRFFFKLDLIVV